MNNMIKKLILLILIFIIVLIGINIYTSLINTHSKEYESDIISKSNAKTLEIYNHRITNLSERSGNDVTAIVKMKNTSNLNIGQIVVYYDELDRNNKVVSDSKMDMDITLSPKEVMQVQFTPKDYTDTIEITGYTYIVEDCYVQVSLKDNEVKILENKEYLENSKNYEVMSINKISKNRIAKNELIFVAEIKNISQKNLGKIDHIIYNSILKPEEEGEIVTSLYNSNYDVKILGYTYDDMENKSNIDIDLITHKVNIIDNKQ